jgi:hypothetical protein
MILLGEVNDSGICKVWHFTQRDSFDVSTFLSSYIPKIFGIDRSQTLEKYTVLAIIYTASRA